MDYITLTISLIALTISGLTFWLTRIKSGVVKMTRPTVIFFGPDGAGAEHKKVFIRTLLYSTSDKGKYIQNMFVRLQRGESVQNFNVWVYDNNGLVRGSGLFINKNGIACNHHFLMPKDGTKYDFLAGKYLLQVFVESVDENPKKIFEQRLALTKNQEDEMKSKSAGTYFDWAPNTQNYFSHIDTGPKKDKELTNLIEKLMDEKE
ncbi:hypothetical protein L0P88_11940 [Muricauda sp. SCSIO 64092]|uniref:hypothetical protein n=1 Tax=Allomuricauda sp. SCSIO 64092 TaxID=2908842 RepID=UPI001FF21279|nr:hypothetical protein [Muricauda sp. SCSIO 64092]UOY09223.1 hypothetical protein L0P88_11940 [Muricauda sp. SCSIO 64092]